MSAPAAMREAHAHVHALGRSRAMVDLAPCTSPAEALDLLADRARSAPPGQAILAHGARPDAWTPPRWPALADLDRAVDRRPCCAWCFDYHALIATTAMLEHAGIRPGTPDPPGGLIARDDQGRPTGVVYEAAATLVWNSLPDPAPAQRLEELRAGLDALAPWFREVHDLKSQRWLGPALADLGHDLPARVVLFPLLDDLDHALDTRRRWESDRVRLGGAKVFVDGTLNSRTAWMLQPFADGRPEHPRGTPLLTPDQVEHAVRRCDRAGVPLAAHAIGDAAVRAVLDAVERVRPATPGFRIEHAEVIHPDDVPRFARLGVVASVQPCHLLTDIEALRRAIPDRLGRVLPLRDLIDAGCEPGSGLIFGSDAPIVRPDPGDSILAATLRRRADMRVGDAIAPEQAITESESRAAFTPPD